MLSDDATIDRAITEAVLFRVAVSAFTYYPDKHTEQPGYTVDEDVAWCLEPLAGLDARRFERLREQLREVIVDTTADRQAFIAQLAALAGE